VVSASGTTNAIVWAYENAVLAVLDAHDASTSRTSFYLLFIIEHAIRQIAVPLSGKTTGFNQVVRNREASLKTALRQSEGTGMMRERKGCARALVVGGI
jgi:hypothetical protein